jgi:hypothetical protein
MKDSKQIENRELEQGKHTIVLDIVKVQVLEVHRLLVAQSRPKSSLLKISNQLLTQHADADAGAEAEAIESGCMMKRLIGDLKYDWTT